MKTYILGSESHDQPNVVTSITKIEAENVSEAKTKYRKPINYMYTTVVLGEIIDSIPYLITRLALEYSIDLDELNNLSIETSKIIFVDKLDQ